MQGPCSLHITNNADPARTRTAASTIAAAFGARRFKHALQVTSVVFGGLDASLSRGPPAAATALTQISAPEPALGWITLRLRSSVFLFEH